MNRILIQPNRSHQLSEEVTATPVALPALYQSVNAFNQTGGYDATKNRGRRQIVYKNLRDEDRLLKRVDRDILISSTRSLVRNASIVAWAVRRHLDYVSTFTFQVRTGKKELDLRIEELFDWWSRPLNCNVTGRHDLYQMIRLCESLATVDGDVFVYKLDDGRMQIIEGDRVRTPTDLGKFAGKVKLDDFVHGVRVDDYGMAMEYALCTRKDNKYVLQELVSCVDVFHYGNFTRNDQIRGISPLASAINTFTDLYESQEYALAKAKLQSIFALKFKRSADSEPDDSGGSKSFNFGGGPQTLDLDYGDDAEFLESDSPGANFQAFLQEGIQIGLKSLDIPASFYDEARTNYAGARQALLQYEQSADIKRDVLRNLLHGFTVWRLMLFVADGHLVLPDGIGIDDIKFEWVGAGLPWIDPVKEASADISLINAGLRTRQEISKERGKDWYQIADQLANEQNYISKIGLRTDQPLPQLDYYPEVDAEKGGRQAKDKKAN